MLICLICLKVVLLWTSCTTSALFYAAIIYNYIIIYCFNLQLCYWGFTSADFSSLVLSVDKTLRIASLFSLNTWNNTHSFQMKITVTFCMLQNLLINLNNRKDLNCWSYKCLFLANNDLVTKKGLFIVWWRSPHTCNQLNSFYIVKEWDN